MCFPAVPLRGGQEQGVVEAGGLGYRDPLSVGFEFGAGAGLRECSAGMKSGRETGLESSILSLGRDKEKGLSTLALA